MEKIGEDKPERVYPGKGMAELHVAFRVSATERRLALVERKVDLLFKKFGIEIEVSEEGTDFVVK